MSIVFICDFNMQALLGHGDVSCFHCKLCHLLLGSYYLQWHFLTQVVSHLIKKIGTPIDVPIAHFCGNVKQLTGTTTSIQLALIHW